MMRKHKTIPIFVPHRGCPLNCLFCNQRSITGQKDIMTPSLAEDIINVGILNKKPGETMEIGFFGGSFTGIPIHEQKEFLNIAYQAMRNGKVDGIRLSTRPDYITEEILDMLIDHGVTCVELGAQSMDDTVLLNCNRGHCVADTMKASEIIRKKGIALGLQMMLGLPGDCAEKAVFTAKEFIRMGASCVRIYPTLVLKNTGLADLYTKGEYVPLSLEKSVQQGASVYRLFKKDNVEVLRMGLLSVDQEEVLDGPWHPAYGELVLSRVFLEEMIEALSHYPKDTVKIHVNPKDLSIVFGQKKENIKKIYNLTEIKNISVIEDSCVKRGEFRIQD